MSDITTITTDEQRYLMAAFAASPRDWFRPRTVGTRDFSDREIDRIVEALHRRGLMQAEPQLHARLTDRGRKEASHLCELAKRDWPKFYNRRRTRIAVASTIVAFVVSLALLHWAGVV